MKFKITKITVKPDSVGAEAGLRSNVVNKALKEIADDLSTEFDSITGVDGGDYWEVKEDSRSDRPVFNVVNDDPAVKWREVADGNLAKAAQSNNKKGSPRGKSGKRVRRK